MKIRTREVMESGSNTRRVKAYRLSTWLAFWLVLLSQYGLSLYFANQEEQRWFVMLCSIAPVLWFYCAVRYAFPPLSAAILVVVINALIHVAHRTKLALTADPLSWGDLTNTANLSIVGQYISVHQIVLIVAFLALTAFLIRRESKIPGKHRFVWVRTASMLIVTPLAFQPYFPEFAQTYAVMARDPGVIYRDWDWSGNVMANGLPMHLVQTSLRDVPKEATPDQRSQFERLLRQSPTVSVLPPQKIIMILCEACWHDAHNFKDLFEPLRGLGMREFRVISPAYGGGTVNAAFELLTGLPSSGVLSGVVYQEYGRLIADDAFAWPRQLGRIGYDTVFMHHHSRSFWQRHVVVPKLGFSEFYGREDLRIDDPEYFAPDRYLYEAAWRRLERYPNRKTFMHLTSVYTHGPYISDEDMGERDYSQRTARSIKETANFIAKVKSRFPDSLVFLVVDHKPALTHYFFSKGVFESRHFAMIGNSNESFVFDPGIDRKELGDVPGYIYYPDAMRIQKFLSGTNDVPMFCLTQLLDREFVMSGLPAFEFSRRDAVCDVANQADYAQLISAFPEWLFDLSLFNPFWQERTSH